MLLFTLLMFQTVPLESVTHGKIRRFETNRHGHFMIDHEGRAFHWSMKGHLLFSLDRKNKMTATIYPVEGGYAVTWVNPKLQTIGVEKLNHFGVIRQALPKMLSWWFFELDGRLYGSSTEWVRGVTQIVPISTDGGKLERSYSRKHFFDPGSHGAPMDTNFKRVWAVKTDQGAILATPLEPTYYVYRSGEFVERVIMPIEWVAYKEQFSGKKSFKDYLKSFNRIAYFGSTDKGLLAAVEQCGGQTTKVYWFDNGKVLQTQTINGWANRGQVLTGSDGAVAWVFDPSHFMMKAID